MGPSTSSRMSSRYSEACSTGAVTGSTRTPALRPRFVTGRDRFRSRARVRSVSRAMRSCSTARLSAPACARRRSAAGVYGPSTRDQPSRVMGPPASGMCNPRTMLDTNPVLILNREASSCWVNPFLYNLRISRTQHCLTSMMRIRLTRNNRSQQRNKNWLIVGGYFLLYTI